MGLAGSAALALALGACGFKVGGAAAGDARPPDVAVDGALDTAVDGSVDGAIDSPVDAMIDAPASFGAVGGRRPSWCSRNPATGDDDPTLTGDMLEMYFNRNSDIYVVIRAKHLVGVGNGTARLAAVVIDRQRDHARGLERRPDDVPVEHAHPVARRQRHLRLDADRVDPGGWALAQLFLAAHVTTVWWQPFVVRDSSAEHTLGGGRVLQPVAVKLRRRHVESLERIEKLGADDPLVRADAAGWCFGYAPFRGVDLMAAVGVGRAAADAVAARAAAAGVFVPLTSSAYLHQARLRELDALVLGTLHALHAESPLHTSHDRQKVLARLAYVPDHGLLRTVIDRLLAAGHLVGDAKRVARADFKPKMSVAQRKLKDRIVADHRAAGFAPPDPASFVNVAGGNAGALGEIFEVAVAEGQLVKVAADLFLHAEADDQLRQVIAAHLRTSAGLTVAEIRDLLGTTRKYAVPLCEYLDRVGVTRRRGRLAGTGRVNEPIQ